MEPGSLYSALVSVNEKPDPLSAYTAIELWTDEHTSGQMLAKFEAHLSDRGRVVLDMYSLVAFADKQEGLVCEKNQLNGFWSEKPYFGFVASFKYGAAGLQIDEVYGDVAGNLYDAEAAEFAVVLRKR